MHSVHPLTLPFGHLIRVGFKKYRKAEYVQRLVQKEEGKPFCKGERVKIVCVGSQKNFGGLGEKTKIGSGVDR